MLTASEESWSVSPEAQAFDALRAAENKKVPAVAALHTEMSVMVSEVAVPPVPFVHDGVLLSARAPADAVENVAATRVVVATLVFAVPALPGAPV